MSSTGTLLAARLEHHGAYGYPIIEIVQGSRSDNVKLQKSGPDQKQRISQAQLGNSVRVEGRPLRPLLRSSSTESGILDDSAL